MTGKKFNVQNAKRLSPWVVNNPGVSVSFSFIFSHNYLSLSTVSLVFNYFYYVFF